MRADSGYTHAVVAVGNLRRSASITIRQRASLRAIQADWRPIPYWIRRRRRGRDRLHSLQSKPDPSPAGEAHSRFPAPIRQLQLSRLHHRHGDNGGRPSATPRSHPSLRRGTQSSRQAVSPPTPPGWPSNWPVGQRASVWASNGDHQDPAATLLLPGRTAYLGRSSLHLPQGAGLGEQVPCPRRAIPSLGATAPNSRPPGPRTAASSVLKTLCRVTSAKAFVGSLIPI